MTILSQKQSNFHTPTIKLEVSEKASVKITIDQLRLEIIELIKTDYKNCGLT